MSDEALVDYIFEDLPAMRNSRESLKEKKNLDDLTRCVECLDFLWPFFLPSEKFLLK